MKKGLYTFLKNFIKCGVMGWCFEIIFTALDSLRRRDFKLKGNTSIWMFPIYGCAALLSPIGKIMHKLPLWIRGTTYMSLIFSAEYFCGALLKKRGLCPWDYGRCRFHINRLIRLDFAPYWFFAGLLFEQALLNNKQRESK